MSLIYDRYLHHFEAGQQALQDGRHADARRELLQASRYILRLAEEGDDPAMQRARKRKGLQLLELAQSISAGSHATGSRTTGSLAEPTLERPAEEAQDSRWEQVDNPGVNFDDIAGLQEIKDLIRQRVIYPFQNPELAAEYGRRPGGGVLMYGPPGTGKTMMAKGIATELKAPFYNVLCSDIMSKWVGDSEQNLKELMEAARAHPVAVIFLDETEALIGKRGGRSTVMNRLIPEFLAQIDGLSSGEGGLLLLGATNRPWDLDPAALRHGRFGEHIYIGLPDPPARRKIIEIALDGIPLADDIELDKIAEQTAGFSGADLKGLAERIIDPAYASAMETGQRVTVTMEHVQQALDRSRPSVSEKELQRYVRFRDDGE